ncbi:hypothetical protein KVT40_002541 [Elsinoe batatas]|uniref:PHD-type domain-containing protein n=1 Tax=Elsinoe batatas TaxID=2601811 RepID=A0A8K0L2G2_9PEZI|nr:hypothetical protein KVT40_002541 [Elsinoe batatas]
MPSAVGKGKPRSSRLSSPQVRNGVPIARESPSEWSEPSVKDAQASFEEHGGLPFGVLEDMQPLGQRPSAKVKTRVKAEPLRKSLGKSMGNLQEYTITPEGTPPVETPRSTSVVPQEEPALVPIPTMEDEADDDYMPRVGKKSVKVSRRTRGSSGFSEAIKAASPSLPPPTSVTAKAPTPSALVREPRAPDMSSQEMEQVNFDLVVDSAEKRARALGSEAFGAALRQVYYESRTNDHYTHLLRSILLQTATEEDKSDFTTAIKKAKRTLRRSLPPKAPSEIESSIIEHTPTSKSRPAQAARTSIENGKPSIRLNFKGRQVAADSTVEDPAPSLRQTRSREKSLSAPLSDVPADIEMMDPPHDHELVKAATSTNALRDNDQNSELSDLMSGDSLRTAENTPVPVQERETGTGGFPNGITATKSDDGQNAGQDLRALKRTPLDAGFDQPAFDEIEHSKRQRLHETLYKDPPRNTVEESHIRESTEAPRSMRNRESVNYKPTLKLTNGTPNTRQKGGGREPSDSPLSDMSMSPPPVINPPTDATANRNKKKAKTKQSPEKKQHAAQDERGLRGPSHGPYEDDEESDNSDYCNACGGTGYLLCCDGCDRAFHFSCVDPPLDVNSSALDEPWYCHTCVAKKNPPARQARGLFAGLLSGLEKRNPSIFTLPPSLQTYFTGIGVGKDGKFEDLSAQRARNTRAGYDEPFETLKIKDNKGNNILCYHCGRSAAGKREIITCDICGNHWHLDCTNPPLANPPFRDQYNRKAREWMCPLHVEHDLSAIDPIRLARRRKLHIRRPKNARIVDTSLRRGFVNNGQIEIIDDTSSAEDTEFDEDETASGTVIRVPSKGIKLDFIDKVQRVRTLEGAEANLPPAKRTRINSSFLRAELNSRAVAERQAALELVQFASQQNDISIAPEHVENLIYTLTAEAPKEVIDQIAGDEDESNLTNGLASPPPSDKSGATASLSDKQRKELEALQELIKRRLETAIAASGI